MQLLRADDHLRRPVHRDVKVSARAHSVLRAQDVRVPLMPIC